MIVFTNKCCEVLPIDETQNKVEILRQYNDLVYEVRIDGEKKKHINFEKPTDETKEYPIMIVLPNSYKNLMFVGADKKRYVLRRDIIAMTLLGQGKKYKWLNLKYFYMSLKLFLLNIKLWFMKLWHSGVLNKPNIYIDEATMQNCYPLFWNHHIMFKKHNETLEAMVKFNKKYENVKETKKNIEKWKNELIEYANKIN